MEFFCESMTNQVNFGLSVKKASGEICVPCMIRFSFNGEKVSVLIDNLSLKFNYSSPRLDWTVNYDSDEEISIFIKKGLSERCTPAYVYVPQVDDYCLTKDGEELAKSLNPTLRLANYTSIPDKEIFDFVTKLKLRLTFMTNPITEKTEEISEKKHTNFLPSISDDLRQKIQDSSRKMVEKFLNSHKFRKEDFQPDRTTHIENEFVKICKDNDIVFHMKQEETVNKIYGVAGKFSVAMILPAQVFKEITGFSTDKEKVTIYVYKEDEQFVFCLGILKFYNPIPQSLLWKRFVEILKEKSKITDSINEAFKQIDNSVDSDKRKHVVKILELIYNNWDLFHDYDRFVRTCGAKCDEFENFIMNNQTIPEAKEIAEAVKKCRLAMKLSVEYNNSLKGF